MGCQAASRGAPAALLEVRQEAMHGTDIHTDEATRLQKSLSATAERSCGKIEFHSREQAVNYHNELREFAERARKVAEQIHQPGYRDAGDLQPVRLALIEHQLGAIVSAIDDYLQRPTV
jgi:hypothetical protein